MRPVVPILVAVLAVVATPVASAQNAVPVERCERECDPRAANDGVKGPGHPVEVFFYAHLDELWTRGFLNVQPPTPDESIPAGIGETTLPTLATDTGVCIEGTSTCTDLSFKNNQVTLEFTPGPAYRTDEGWRAIRGRGLGYDIELTQESPRLYWYMSAQNAVVDKTRQYGGVAPALDVHAKLVQGTFGDGVTISESVPTPTLSRPTLVTTPGSRNVYEFEVPLHYTTYGLRIPQEEAFRLEVRWSQVKVGHVVEATQQDWRVHVGPEYQPRLVLPMYDPAQVVNETLTHFGGRYYVQWKVQAALGHYDVDEATLRIDTVGAPNGARFELDHLMLRRPIDCHGEHKPVTATWELDYRNATLPDGSYTLRASVLNLQGTYRVSSDFTFDVVGGVPEGVPVFPGEASVPGLGIPSLATLIGLAAFAVSRRRAA